ncbi:hypothetical protein, partial [Gluconobacter sp. P1D12_c]|uniref:hypothetical protein n=1 Tax=Gluconobacter sp. P1D12_c TaxID=2762614 RepID=UPI001C03C290
KDAGTLESVDEVTKYVTKPNDIETMEDGHLEWFYNETLNTRLIQRYGSFRSSRGLLMMRGFASFEISLMDL